MVNSTPVFRMVICEPGKQISPIATDNGRKKINFVTKRLNDISIQCKERRVYFSH